MSKLDVRARHPVHLITLPCLILSVGGTLMVYLGVQTLWQGSAWWQGGSLPECCAGGGPLIAPQAHLHLPLPFRITVWPTHPMDLWHAICSESHSLRSMQGCPCPALKAALTSALTSLIPPSRKCLACHADWSASNAAAALAAPVQIAQLFSIRSSSPCRRSLLERHGQRHTGRLSCAGVIGVQYCTYPIYLQTALSHGDCGAIHRPTCISATVQI